LPHITFLEADGTVHRVETGAGTSVKQAALDNGVPGILGDCGGNTTCGTCHGYVDPGFLGLLPPVSEDEEAILDGVPGPLAENSRLTCQITMSEDLDGIIVALPVSQV
jgi:2Fe-2S ferredoxin